MTENIPPAPGQGQPQGSWQPQGSHPQQGHFNQNPQPQPGTYFQPPGYWVPVGPAMPKSSGYRVAAGIVEIVLGLWLFFPAVLGFRDSWEVLGFLFLVAALGNLIGGIVLLVKHRDRAPAVPVTSLTFAGLAALLVFVALIADFYGAGLATLTFPVVAPVLIVMSLGLAREKRGL